MLNIVIILGIFFLIYLAIKSRIFLNRQRRKELPETINSPFSEAITQLLGIAGGIYLSLVMLSSFLSIPIPETISFFSWTVDPLALFSLLIAVFQPLMLTVLKRII